MTKQTINVGTSANDRKGDSLRAAFTKVNNNFTELYTALGLADTTLNLGAFTFTGSTMSTDDSTAIVIDKPITVNGEITVDGDITPKTNLGASLGTPTKQFKSLYVSTNTVFLGGVPLSLEAGTNELTINNVPISQTINYTDIPNAPKDLSDLTDNDGSLGGGVTSYNDLTNKPTLFSGSYNDLTNKPNLAGTYQFSVAADDSTQRLVSTDEVIKFIGAGGITTASDAEGNITITGSGGSSLVNGAYTASLGNTGALTLPAGGVISEGGGLSGAIKLRPAGGANANQALLIYPTAGGEGDHIHLTAGGGSTELYLGNDSRYVKLVNGGDIAVLANNGAANRVFNWVGQGGWNQGSYTAVATTGGTGTGLTVNVAAGGAGYININAITINNPGTGYTDGDVITINNENNLPGSFQIGVAANNWTFGTDGSLASNEFKIKTLDGIPNSITGQTNDTQYWDYNYGSNLATTGGTGSGLFVNVSDGGSGYASIAINVAGTGYSPGDIITVTNGPLRGAGAGSSVTFTIGVSGTRSWTFDRYGALTLPSNGSIQSANPNTRAKVTLNPYRVLSQVRTSIVQSYSVGGGAFTSAASDGTGTITFVGLEGYVAEYFVDNLDIGTAVEDKRVQINGAGLEYEYFSFNNPDQILLNGYPTAPPAGAVTSITVKYTRVSKIDICPDDGEFRIQSESGQDIDINAGRYLDIVADRRVTMTAGDEMRLRSGTSEPVIISTNYPGLVTPTLEWQFGAGGDLTFPYGAVLKDTVGNAIAFGNGAGQNSQGAMAIAIGSSAGYYPQGAAAVAIGESAGESYQGANAIAIGKKAGYYYQAANSIILNATGNPLEQTTANTFTVKPVRQGETATPLYYNSSTGEITYADAYAFSFSVAADDSTQRAISNNELIKFTGAGGITTSSDAEGNITITGSGAAAGSLTGTALASGVVSSSLTSVGTLGTLRVTGAATADSFNTDQITIVGNRITTTVTNANLELECNGTGGVVVNGGKLILNTGGNAYVESVDYGVNSANSALNIFGGPYQKINLRAGFGTQATWTFGTDGSLTFPNATVQTTAWTGVVGTQATLNVTGTVTAETFNTDQITVVGNRISTTVTNANLELECNGSGGVVINTVAEATTASTVKSVGYLGLPQSATATTATLAIGDAGKHIYVTTASQTITIPANASVAYPIGTTLTFIAGPSATTVTIAITTDTLRLAGGTSTGSRTLAANGMATAVKVAATTWYINGTGLT
jgi:hypothetical protein